MLPASIEGPAILAEIAVWGAMGWAFYPAQASRMVLLAPDAAVVALSLNASALYFGIALGGGLGALVLTFASPADLGIAAALCGLIALGLLSLSLRLADRRRQELAAQPAE
jgi:predicted MFS family arabinose efflux permease